MVGGEAMVAMSVSEGSESESERSVTRGLAIDTVGEGAKRRGKKK